MNRTVTKRSPNFWKSLPKPFFALAPMANVTDSVFRKMIAKYGKPDVMWTEFVSADGLISAGKKNLLIDLKYSNKERPIVAQLFTGHPDVMRKAAKIIADLGFDGLDINMGCPDRAVEKSGGGAAMMKDPKLAIEILDVAREGARTVSLTPPTTFPRDESPLRQLADKSRGNVSAPPRDCSRQKPYSTIPVSVKTRIGYNKIDLEWIRTLLEQKLPALTVHLRTRKEMSDASAHWEIMPEIVKLRNEISPETLIVGNGDVESVEDGISKCRKYGCDGVMIGRGIFGKPWFFECRHDRRGVDKCKIPTAVGKDTSSSRGGSGDNEEDNSCRGGSNLRLKIMLEHAKLFEKTFCGKKHLKNFAVMKKHFKAYVSGWEGAKELRVKLMAAQNYANVEKVVKEYLSV